jgi:glycosyltransferase involved in cell wall biosynthesis
MKILIATDAYTPQINGVVTTLTNTAKVLIEQGHSVSFIEPSHFKIIPFKLYPDVDFAWNVWTIGKMIAEQQPDTIHIATEGPIGIATRIYCEAHRLNYTTSYHTKFPEYMKKILKFIPIHIPYTYVRWFHNKSRATLVTNEDMKQELKSWGFNEDRLKVWTRGADLELFHPSRRSDTIFQGLPRPIIFYFGRVSREKNIEDFCKIKAYTKVVIGDGPFRGYLEKTYPDIIFTGMKIGIELAQYVASGDVFVFPSTWDTFGVVMIEANACGVPIAAYPVTGPRDFIKNGVNGYLSTNLELAIEEALKVPRASCRDYVEKYYTWEQCANIFLKTAHPNATEKSVNQ